MSGSIPPSFGTPAAAGAAGSPIAVGLGQAALGRAGEELVSFGLGSCVGLALWAPRLRIGALCHIMLPDSRSAPLDPEMPARYADWGVSWAVAALAAQGCQRHELIAKLAGGARVLSLPVGGEIGRQNAEATLAALRNLGIAVRASDLGGHAGRTVRFFPDTGLLAVRLVNGEQATL